MPYLFHPFISSSLFTQISKHYRFLFWVVAQCDQDPNSVQKVSHSVGMN